MKLPDLGWNEFFQTQLDGNIQSLLPARVRRQDSDGYLLLCEAGEMRGTISGRLRHNAVSRAELPVVGDWVLVHPDEGDGAQAVIERVLQRSSAFSRKEAGERTDEQVVAANIDVVFIVCGLDGNFNVRRIERYLFLAEQSGGQPVILLTKRDLIDDPAAAIDEVRRVAPETPVLALSAITDEGMDQLAPYLGAGTTVTLLGSSGVGKSTIVNALLGRTQFETREVRADSKGRHTTTWRELVVLPSGCLVIDTPGMRELQIWADEASLAQSFEEIEALASSCRYRDCAHDSEPGCAVKSAVDTGELAGERLESYFRFKREIEWLARQQDAQAKAEQTKERRRFAKAIRNRPDKRD